MNLSSVKLYCISIHYHVHFLANYLEFNNFDRRVNSMIVRFYFKTILLGYPVHIPLYCMDILIYTLSGMYKKYILEVVVVRSSIFLIVIIKYNLTYLLIAHKDWAEEPEVTNKLIQCIGNRNQN